LTLLVFAHQVRRLQRNLLAGLDSLLDLSQSAAGVGVPDDDLAPHEAAVWFPHRHVILVVEGENRIERKRESVVVLRNDDLDLGRHARAERLMVPVEHDPRRVDLSAP
jgi:hypothetical protein